MKKALKLLWFLNKKGCFALGVLVGLLVALFCSSALEVHAEEMPDDSEEETQQATQQATQQVIMYTTQNAGGSWNVDIDGTHYYIGSSDVRDVAAGYIQSDWHLNSNDKEVINVWLVLKRDSGSYYCSYEDWREKLNGNSVILSTTYSLNSSNFTRVNDSDFTKYIANVYIFSTRDECEAYLNGELDASAAINYEEIVNLNSSIDYNIGICDYAYYSAIADDCAVLCYGFDDLDYEFDGARVTTYFYYVPLSNLDIMFGVDSLESITHGKGFDSENIYDIDGRYRTDLETIEGYDGSDDVGIYICNNSDIRFDSPPLDKDNVVRISPPTYSGATVGDPKAWLLWGYRSDIQLYMYNDDGSIVYTGFQTVQQSLSDNFDKNNGQQLITDKGVGDDDYISESIKQDSGGNMSELDLNNLNEFISDGFGLLGDEGYITMMQMFFLGVPSYIWVLVATAMAVSIIIILFKSLR